MARQLGNVSFLRLAFGAIMGCRCHTSVRIKPYPTWWTIAAVFVVTIADTRIVVTPKAKELYAWHPNGTPLGASQAFKSGLGTYMRVSPSFANLDGDP